jgi:nucleoside-triphosphatase THEP1
MKNLNFYILKGPIRSGKTTYLENLISNEINIAGFLTPDRDGIRMFYDIAKNEMMEFELDLNTSKKYIEVGRFKLSEETFDYAHTLLLSLKSDLYDTIIIDEIGKLEMNNQGYEPALSDFIEYHKSTHTRIILVVRDSLYDSVIEKYDLKNIQKMTLDI